MIIFHFFNPLQAGQLLANQEPSKIRTVSANKLPLEVSFHVAAFATPETKGFATKVPPLRLARRISGWQSRQLGLVYSSLPMIHPGLGWGSY